MTADEFAKVVGTEAGQEMTNAFGRIKHCLDQLSEEHAWRKPDPRLNTIGNLIVHLCGNIRQRLVAGLTGAPDTRNRPAEFADQTPIPKAELLRMLEDTIAEAKVAMTSRTAAELLQTKRIQGRDTTGLAAIFASVPHLRGHTQEIIHMTRTFLGDAYKFAWVPRTPEEGA